jgi:glycosyltransferase involved in cell wall biosynthesis
MRLAWYSNAPDTPTGYGTQTAQVIKRIAADGHVVHVLANYGQIAGIRDWNGIPVWPQGHAQYSLDVIDDQARVIEPDHIFTLYDVWVLRDSFKGRSVLSWTPIDHEPVTPEVHAWAREHRTIAMSRFGQRTLASAGIQSDYVPHAIEDVFRPTESDVRERMKVPADAFLVTINAANIGITPPRKAWDENLQAMSVFMRKHDDVFLYIHTDLVRPGGLPLPILIDALGMPHERLRKVDLMAYRGGLIGEDELANIYSASDVLLAVSMGEGFGVPVIESMGCGTPAIVSDFSAQPELVGDTGWKVPVQKKWDHNQAGFFCTPFVGGIYEALEAAYAARGADPAPVLAQADLYRADRVYAEHWRPLLASLEKPARIGNTKAAKRRKAKRAA